MRPLILAACLSLLAAPVLAQSLSLIGLAEADPGTRANKIILADSTDGAPLPEKDGAFRLVVEGDLRPARSARLVTAIKVVKLGEGQPAGDKDH